MTTRNISSVQAYLHKVGTFDPSAYVFIDISAVDGSGFPTGAILGSSSSVSVSSITTNTSGQWYTFTFSPTITLTVGTAYAFWIRSDLVALATGVVRYWYKYITQSGDTDFGSYVAGTSPVWQALNGLSYKVYDDSSNLVRQSLPDSNSPLFDIVAGDPYYIANGDSFQIPAAAPPQEFDVTAELSAVASMDANLPLQAAINPTPDDASGSIDVSTHTISWQNGGGATKYDVYFNFGNDLAVYPVGTVADDGTTTTYTITWPLPVPGTINHISSFSHGDTYTWRVDSRNDIGDIVTGAEWTFSTSDIYYPHPNHSTTGKWPTPVPKGEDPTIHDGDDLLLGNNSMLVYKRLTACAANTFYYENI